jgi:hypothetical protein
MMMVAALAAPAGPAAAGSVVLVPSKDNTLIQWSPQTEGANPLLSNGRGDIYVGRTNQDGQEPATISIRRGLIQFDVAGAVSSGMKITGATLTMRDVRGLNGDPSVSLHRVLQDWGEGSSFFEGGQGAPATQGDATWLHTFYDASNPAASPTWNSPGGDFEPAASAAATVADDSGGGQLFTWSSAAMAADVQSWLTDPAQNFGWLLQGDETRGQSAKRFNSRESTEPPNVPPMLEIEFEPILAGDYNDNGIVDAADYTAWRDALAAAASLANDLTPSTVDESDFAYWRDHFGESMNSGAGTGASLAAVPEPSSGGMIALGAVAVGSFFKRTTFDLGVD